MEFSLFLLILTLGLTILYILGKALFKWSLRFLWLPVIIAIGAVGLIIIGQYWGAVILGLVIVTLLIPRLEIFRNYNSFALVVPFTLVVLIQIAVYLPQIQNIWINLDGWISQLTKQLEFIRGYRLIEVYYVARYFRFFYPALIISVLYFAFCRAYSSKNYPITFWHRYQRNFDHYLVFLTVAAYIFMIIFYLVAFFMPLTNALRNSIEIWILNLVVIFSVPYIVHGTLILALGLKKLRLPIGITVMAIWLLIIISGSKFIFFGFLLFGLGITDIWMNYSNLRKFHRNNKLT